MPVPLRRSPLALAVLGLLENGPLHPYGLQRLIREWGKDQVVNVGQRTALYRTIDRLETAGLVAAGGTERDERYPERTVYHLTDEGRAASRQWLREILGTPRNEFPEFPVALSFVMMLPPAEVVELLEARREQVAADVDRISAAAQTEIEGVEIPRVALLETEFQRAVLRAEARWITGILGDVQDGRLSWDPEERSAPAQ